LKINNENEATQSFPVGELFAFSEVVICSAMVV
jgi:hypothetical protein